MADHLSSILLCPTQVAVANLSSEGITAGAHHIGDVMYDVTLTAVKRAQERSNVLGKLGLDPKTYAVATIHRAENTDDAERFTRVMNWLSDRGKETFIVMPVHPRTRKLIESHNLKPANINLIEPLGYLDMTLLTHNAVAVFTDSGGLQKEAYFHRVPCVTLRDETEWVETIEAGWNRLWTNPGYKARRDIDEYGSGQSSQKVAALLAEAAR
jgi:UDP-GlcNAc3NAcA epimerase